MRVLAFLTLGLAWVPRALESQQVTELPIRVERCAAIDSISTASLEGARLVGAHVLASDSTFLDLMWPRDGSRPDALGRGMFLVEARFPGRPPTDRNRFAVAPILLYAPDASLPARDTTRLVSLTLVKDRDTTWMPLEAIQLQPAIGTPVSPSTWFTRETLTAMARAEKGFYHSYGRTWKIPRDALRDTRALLAALTCEQSWAR